MTNLALPKPPTIATGYRWLDPPLRLASTLYWVLVQVPVHGLKVYPPVLFIAATAAYASSRFAEHHGVFPAPLSWLLAIAFEWVYIGTLALSGAKKSRWFYVVLLSGAITSVTFIMLHAAARYGIMADLLALTPAESHTALRLVVNIVLVLAHSLPLTSVNVVYGFLIHQHNAEQAEIDKRACPYGCGYVVPADAASPSHVLRGHLGQCPNKPRP